MKTATLLSLVAAMLLSSAALAPVGAADMTFERALNADKEPQNWILHHQNYQGYRFSRLPEINAGNVKDLRVAFKVVMGGQEGGGRHLTGDLEATPLRDEGIMYLTDGRA